MSDDLKKKSVPLCVVCAQPASKLKCAKCKLPYCSISCQTEDWKKRGHKKTCKRLVKEAAGAAAAEGATRGEASTAPPSPKPKAAPPVVDGPARGRADVARARAAAAAATATTAPAPEPEHWSGTPRCPVCLEDWDVNDEPFFRICCCRDICQHCDDRVGVSDCPLCRAPFPVTDEDTYAVLRRNVYVNKIPAAMEYLGSCYIDGTLGLVPSFKKAARMYQRAADLGDVRSMFKVGVHYFHGRGIKLDTKKTVKYCRMAADRGHAGAQFLLGICLKYGHGATKDHIEAFRFYKLAAEQGHTPAENGIGNLYATGNVVARDFDKAIFWFERAAAKGEESAIRDLANLRARLAG